jgi:hypothetical protein
VTRTLRLGTLETRPRASAAIPARLLRPGVLVLARLAPWRVVLALSVGRRMLVAGRAGLRPVLRMPRTGTTMTIVSASLDPR